MENLTEDQTRAAIGALSRFIGFVNDREIEANQGDAFGRLVEARLKSAVRAAVAAQTDAEITVIGPEADADLPPGASRNPETGEIEIDGTGWKWEGVKPTTAADWQSPIE